IKGLDVLVDAAAGSSAQVVIAGEGPERPALERRARARGAAVRFVGPIGGHTKADWLAAADVFVAPSRALRSGRTEGSPTAVLEAMAAGLPVVASRTGGLPDLVRDGRDGLLVEPDDPVALARAINWLVGDVEIRKRMGRSARRRASAHAWTALAPWLAALVRGDGPA
ncbi:MAG: glycosyltransferase family 4 protein, partial [Myxococcales bacterium]|nr:glycosyltransferase family 4 protein [Myxococcales bacterium]